MMTPDTAPTQRTFWSFAVLGGVERFAWYGVRSLLLLFLVTASVPSAESPGGPLVHGAGWSKEAGMQALLWLSGAAAIAPLLGGLLLDRMPGRERAPALGLMLISAGLIALVLMAVLAATASATTLLLSVGLALLVAGSALLRPAVLLGMAGALADRPYALMGGYVAYSQLIVSLFAMLGPLLFGLMYKSAGFAGGLACGLLVMPLAFWLSRHCHWPPQPAAGHGMQTAGDGNPVRARPLLWLLAVLIGVAAFTDWTQQRVDQALAIRPLFSAIGIDNASAYGMFEILLVLIVGVALSVWWLRRRAIPDWRRQALLAVLLIAGLAASVGGAVQALNTGAMPVLLIALGMLFVVELLLEAVLFALLARLRHTPYAATVYGLFLALPASLGLLIARHPDAIWPASLFTGLICVLLLLALFARPPRYFLAAAQ